MASPFRGTCRSVSRSLRPRGCGLLCSCWSLVFFGPPVQRARVWFLCVARRRLPPLVTYQQFRDTLSGAMNGLVGHKLQSLDSLLLPETDKLILQHYELLGQRSPAVTQGSWVRQHQEAHDRDAVKASRTRSRSRCSLPSPWARQATLRSLMTSYPGLQELSSRELDLLELRGVAGPSRDTQVFSVQRSLQRESASNNLQGVCCAVLPGGRLVEAKRLRLVRGHEFMVLQGIIYNDAEKAKFENDALLRDLAGNAFELYCCAASLVTLVSGVATLSRGLPARMGASPQAQSTVDTSALLRACAGD